MKKSTQKTVLLGLLAMLAVAPTLRAEEADNSMVNEQEEMRAMLGSLTSQLNEMKKYTDEAPKIGINVDLRVDNQVYNTGTIATSLTATAGGVLFKQNALPNGKSGMYAKRAEFEFKGKISSWAGYHFQYEAATNKLEDLGVEMTDIAMLPMVDTGSYKMTVKVGQFRQPFGIEPQTGSSSTPLPERALMYGGANPFNGAYATSKLATERVMGLHVKHNHSLLGFIAYDLGLAVVNDVNDQPAATNSIPASQVADQDPTEIARLGLTMSFLDSVKDIVAVKFGASVIHDSQNTVFMSSSSTSQAWADVAGFDANVDLFKNWHLQGEWAGKNNFNAIAGFTKRQEGWYLLSTMEPLKWFDKDAAKIEWNTRYEGFMADVDAMGKAVNPFVTSDNALTTGIKWSFVGKNYTSINYTTYALSNNFGALAGTEMWTLQQQFNY